MIDDYREWQNIDTGEVLPPVIGFRQQCKQIFPPLVSRDRTALTLIMFVLNISWKILDG